MVLAGASLGGAVALDFAWHYPEVDLHTTNTRFASGHTLLTGRRHLFTDCTAFVLTELKSSICVAMILRYAGAVSQCKH